MREVQVMLGATPCHNRVSIGQGRLLQENTYQTCTVTVPNTDQHLQPHTNEKTDRIDKFKQDSDQFW